MARFCTTCASPDRAAIDKAIIGGEWSYRRLSSHFALNEAAIRRHAVEHLLPQLVRDWQLERAETGMELAGELRAWLGRVTKLHDACHEWLTDPDDSTRYNLNPRTTEVVIHAAIDQGPNKPPLRHKLKLSEALAKVNGKEAIGDITLVEAKTADPRELLLKTSARAETHLRLVGELLGKIQVQGTNNFLQGGEWLALRTRMLKALEPFPDARLALAEALEAHDAPGGHDEPPPGEDTVLRGGAMRGGVRR